MALVAMVCTQTDLHLGQNQWRPYRTGTVDSQLVVVIRLRLLVVAVAIPLASRWILFEPDVGRSKRPIV